MKKIVIIILCLLLACLTFTAGCDIPNPFAIFEDPVKQAVNVLDDAIRRLDDSNANWQSILTETREKLTDEAQSTIRTEVDNVLQRGIAASGGEFRCDYDFIRNRVRQDLIRIRAGLTGETIPPVLPALCHVVPNNIDMSLEANRRSLITFFGYDFDTNPRPKVFLLTADGSSLDITQYLSVTHHYEMTLNLGQNGVPLSTTSTRIILKWNEEILSEIPIIQPSLPECKTDNIRFRPNHITYVPPHTYGDREFDGNGPSVVCVVHLFNRGDYVQAGVFMEAKETESDWTTARGSRYYTIYTPPIGWKVIKVVPEHEEIEYTDDDHAEDIFFMGGGVVDRFVFIGDTKGSEAGTDTQVTVWFNELQFTIKQYINCV